MPSRPPDRQDDNQSLNEAIPLNRSRLHCPFNIGKLPPLLKIPCFPKVKVSALSVFLQSSTTMESMQGEMSPDFCNRLLLEACAAKPPYMCIPSPEESPSEGYTTAVTDADCHPTHAFALQARDGSTVLYPIHGLVFAANCSLLEQLAPPAELMVSNRVNLPVVSVNLPHPESFTLIRDYLYIKLDDMFYEGIFAWRALDGPPVGMYPGDMIVGLYRNGITLGIVDDQYWKILKRAWIDAAEFFLVDDEHMFDDIRALKSFVKDYGHYRRES